MQTNSESKIINRGGKTSPPENMPKFRIHYFFDGDGSVDIEAQDQEEAEEKWRSGDYREEDEDEGGENYTVVKVEEIDESDDGDGKTPASEAEKREIKYEEAREK